MLRWREEARERIEDLCATACPSTTTSKAISSLVTRRPIAAAALSMSRATRPAARSWARSRPPRAPRPRSTVLEGYTAARTHRAPRPGSGHRRSAPADGEARCRKRLVLPARAVVLATGGVGHVYAVTTNPHEARGEGARHCRTRRRASSPMRNSCSSTRPPSISAAIRRRSPPRRCAATARSWSIRRGERFMRAVHQDAELAPRDVVARAVHREVVSGRGAFLDCRPSGPSSRRSVPDGRRDLPVGRHRSRDRADPGGAGGALPHGRRPHRRARPHHGRRPVGLWRGGLDRRPRRQPAGLELAARGGRVRRARRQRHRDHPAPAAVPEGRGTRAAMPRRAASQPRPSRRSAAPWRPRSAWCATPQGLTRRRSPPSSRSNARPTAIRSLPTCSTTAKLIATAALARTESRGGQFRSDYPADDAQANRSFITLRRRKPSRARRQARQPPRLRVAARVTAPLSGPNCRRYSSTRRFARALAEDLGLRGDITTSRSIPPDAARRGRHRGAPGRA